MTAELVLEILASAIQIGRVHKTISRSETEETTSGTYILPDTSSSSSEGRGQKFSDDDSAHGRKDRPPSFSSDRITQHNSIDIYKARIDNLICEEVSDSDSEDCLRRVRFGSCRIHAYESSDYCKSNESSEFEDLIESEAVALTEDAIFLAKKELYREMTKSNDNEIKMVAQKIVAEAIENVIADLKGKESDQSSDSDEITTNFTKVRIIN